MNDIIHIMSHFSKYLKQRELKSKFYAKTIVMSINVVYKTLEDIFSIAVNNKKVQFTDIKNF